MDKKYLGKVVNLPKATYESITEVQAMLTEKLGFTPSLSESIQYLATFYKKATKEGSTG